MSELRQDPLTGRQVIIAPGRAARPWHINVAENKAGFEKCPFCAGNETLTPAEVWAERDHDSAPDAPGWRVRVVPNKYPALTNGSPVMKPTIGSTKRAALGVHEVIIETPAHAVHMQGFGSPKLASILRAYRERLSALQNDPRWRYLLIYKNQGERAGATLDHVHSQLVALPAVPPAAMEELRGARTYFKRARQCIFCDLIARAEGGARLVLDSGRFVALCPFASRFAYETWILPKSHATHFIASSDEDLAALGELLRRLIAKLNHIAEQAPFNYLLHSAPLRKKVDAFYHWHLEILPQIHRAAGFEWGTGRHINPLAPEEAARLLRDAPG